MTTNEKRSIATLLASYCEQKGSQNKAAKSLNNVSPATITQILTDNWELISDDMWRNVAGQIGYDRRSWNIVETKGYSKMYKVLSDAQNMSLVLGVCGDAGSGKTEAVKSYVMANRNVYHLCCSEYWNRKQFMMEMLQSLGMECTGTVSEMMSDIVLALKKKESPIIILDEADKLSDQVLYFFISLYNKLEDRCGIVMAATDYLEKRIKKGVRTNRKGYKEIFSRLGRKFIYIPIASSMDVEKICVANGIDNKSDINKIIEESECDLRRVKRLVYAIKLDRD
jgi:Uncharacterized ATPase, putative transposase